MVRFIRDIINYVSLLEKSNSFREETVELPRSEYKTVYGENVKGEMFKNKFYTKFEYKKLVKSENDTKAKRIVEIEQKIQELIDNDTN